MTAAELFEVVKDVPREAWPLGVDFGPCSGGEVGFSISGGGTLGILELAYIGSMTAWLIDQDNSVKSWSPFGEFDGKRFRPVSFVVALNEDDLDEANPHHSLVAALAAACKEAA